MFLKRALLSLILCQSIFGALDLLCDGCNLFRRKPMCGMDGNTYVNRCYTQCNDMKVRHRGQCTSCKCSQYYDPVCASDGQTYSNPCEARCNNASVSHGGRCVNSNCTCVDQERDTVCGTNNRTYANKCEARCAGQNVDYHGACGSCNGGSCRGEVAGGYHSHPNLGYLHYGYM